MLWIPGFRTVFRNLGDCPRLDTRLVLGLPTSLRRLVLYFVFGFIFIFCIRLCPYICMWSSAQDCTYTIPVMNTCTSVVSFLYKCHVCDVVYYLFIIRMCLTLTLLQVLYPTFGLRSASGLSIPNLQVACSLQALMFHQIGESSALSC